MMTIARLLQFVRGPQVTTNPTDEASNEVGFNFVAPSHWHPQTGCTVCAGPVRVALRVNQPVDCKCATEGDWVHALDCPVVAAFVGRVNQPTEQPPMINPEYMAWAESFGPARSVSEPAPKDEQ